MPRKVGIKEHFGGRPARGIWRGNGESLTGDRRASHAEGHHLAETGFSGTFPEG